jgi:hypothetical protein
VVNRYPAFEIDEEERKIRIRRDNGSEKWKIQPSL